MNEENLVFKSLHVSHMSHELAMTLFRETYDVAIPVRTTIGTTADAILTELTDSTAACSAQVNRQRKSALSVTVKALRKTCNNLFAEIKRTVSFNVKSRTETLNKAGSDLKFFFRPNWNIQKDALPTQIDMTSNWLEKYHADSALVAAGQVASIDALISELEATNANLHKIYFDRLDEVGNRPASGTNLRPAANDSYMQFCTAIEQAARYTPNDEVIELFHVMNVYRKTAHKLLAGKKQESKTE